jgi:hypothetical protein
MLARYALPCRKHVAHSSLVYPDLWHYLGISAFLHFAELVIVVLAIALCAPPRRLQRRSMSTWEQEAAVQARETKGLAFRCCIWLSQD